MTFPDSVGLPPIFVYDDLFFRRRVTADMKSDPAHITVVRKAVVPPIATDTTDHLAGIVALCTHVRMVITERVSC